MATRREALAFTAGAFLQPAAARLALAETSMLTRLREIRELVLDPKRVFSISKTLAELDEIEPKISGTGPDSPERGELNYLRGFIHYKAKRPEQSIPSSLEAIRIDDAAPFLPPPLKLKFVYNVATQAAGLERWSLAIAHYKKALALFHNDPDATEDHRLGTMQSLAYCLQEAGQSAEAKTVNEEVLAGGERLHGAESPKLLTVLNNLAQNVYDLGDLEAPRPLLERRLAIALKHGDDENAEDSLFQLGVLAFETGRRDEAETLMKRRLAMAEKSGDQSRIRAAKVDLEELYDKLRNRK